MNKRTLDWKATAFVVAVGTLKLLGLLVGAVKPHLTEAASVGMGVNVTAAAVLSPTPEIRRCGGGGAWGGRAGDAGHQYLPRIRLAGERRESTASPAVTVQVNSSSR